MVALEDVRPHFAKSQEIHEVVHGRLLQVNENVLKTKFEDGVDCVRN